MARQQTAEYTVVVWKMLIRHVVVVPSPCFQLLIALNKFLIALNKFNSHLVLLIYPQNH